MDVEIQPACLESYQKKYQLKDNDGIPVDKNITDTYMRVARSLASLEELSCDESYSVPWYEKFFWALENGAIPAGRIVSNAGAMDHKRNTSTINCTVSGTIHDSMHSILEKVFEAGMTLKSGCGIGYDFSTLRPSGAFVSGAGATTSGPLSFMDIYDAVCRVISSAGGRRGAQMGTMDISHPDTPSFITAKREDGRLRKFNLSVLLTDKFMQSVKDDGYWVFWFPFTKYEFEQNGSNPNEPMFSVDWRQWPYQDDNHVINDDGMTACRPYGNMKSKELFNLITRSTYEYAEPGIIFIDKMNSMNNLWFCENIRATNP